MRNGNNDLCVCTMILSFVEKVAFELGYVLISPFSSQLRVAKEAAAVPVAATQPSYNKSSQEVNEWDQPQRTPSPQVAAPAQQSNASSPYVTDYGAEAEDGFGYEDCKLFYTLS